MKLFFKQVMPPDHDVVEHAHVLEQREVLEGAADAEPGPGVGIERGDVLPAIEQLAFGRPVAARDAVDDRGLAGAVGADDREQLAVVDAKTDIGERTHATEAQRHPAHFQSVSHSFLRDMALGALFICRLPSRYRSYIGRHW